MKRRTIISGGAALVAAFGPSLLPGPAVAQSDATADPCAILDAVASPAPQALLACRLDRETRWGPEDPRLVALYGRLAERLSDSQARAAAAVPYRRRAYQLAGRLHGRTHPEVADTALDYARTWILSGRCEPNDPRVIPLLDAAARGFAALPADDADRSASLRQTAAAYADALRYAEAANALEGLGDALAGDDRLRLGAWRAKSGDADAAETAYRAAMLDPDAETAARAKAALKRLFFTTGDLDKARALDAE